MLNIFQSPDFIGLLSAFARLREFLPLESQETIQDIDDHLRSLHKLMDSAETDNQRIVQPALQANEGRLISLSQVSHELRTPLTAIRGYSDLLLRNAVGPLNEAQRNFLEVIIINVDRMAGLLTSVTDISKLESGKLHLQATLCSIHELMEHSLHTLLPKIQEKGQHLIVELPGDNHLVYVDRNRFIQVLINIIANAHYYTPVDGRIEIHVTHRETNILVKVTDNGYGISQEDTLCLFTPFFRSEDPKVRAETGWGLGLYLSKLLMERMGGEIGVTSNYGVGSSFWFTIPINNNFPNQ